MDILQLSLFVPLTRCSSCVSSVLVCVCCRCCCCCVHGHGGTYLSGRTTERARLEDGRLSILRLEQLLKGKISNNTTFQVKSASGGIGGGGGARASSSRPQQLQSDLEVKVADGSHEAGIDVPLAPGSFYTHSKK